jgi:hypothetical protein
MKGVLNVRCHARNSKQSRYSYRVIDPDKLNRYQKYHLILTSVGVFFTIVSLCLVAFQVRKLSEQSERNTVALDLQSKALVAQTESVKAQKRAVGVHL